MPLDFDPRAAREHLARRDRGLARLMSRVGAFGLAPSRGGDPFRSLLKAIVYQQLSGKAAATIHGRVAALMPGGRPTPESLLALDEVALQGAGLSRNKVASVRDLAVQTLAGVVPSGRALRRLPDEQIVARLTQVRGVGVWTVEMLLIFHLGRPDVLPVADLGIRKGFQRVFGGDELPAAAELLARGERWRPYRTMASWYLWRAVDDVTL